MNELLLHRREMMGAGGGGGRLPKEFQEVSGMTAYGSGAYIMLPNLPALTNFKIVVDFYQMPRNQGGVFGISNTYQYYVYGQLNGQSAAAAARCGNGVAYINTGFTPANDGIVSQNGERVLYELDTRTKTASINGHALTWYSSPSSPSLPSNIPVFIRNHEGSISASYFGDIYEFSILDENGDYVIQLIPCYRKADNEAGMYDIVNDVFYTNAGSGSFIVGPNV